MSPWIKLTIFKPIFRGKNALYRGCLYTEPTVYEGDKVNIVTQYEIDFFLVKFMPNYVSFMVLLCCIF